MNRIADAFQNKKAFIAFITVGDPDLATTEKVVRAAVEGGADLIELGIPFSDPTAEGPVIMEADEVALRAGTTTDKVFELTKKLRATVTIPLVYMTYANVVFPTVVSASPHRRRRQASMVSSSRMCPTRSAMSLRRSSTAMAST